MSILVMSTVWSNGPEPQGELLVLLALADFADDSGLCWPSVRRIAEKSRMSERSVQRIMRKLEKDGFLEIDRTSGGRYGTNRYIVRAPVSRGDNLTGLDEKPRQTVHKTPTNEVQNPDTAVSPEPSRTIKEPPFSEFWNSFPHRNNKKTKRQQCEQKFLKAVRSGVSPQQIVRAAEAYHHDSDVKRGYGRSAEAWLNQRGWEDETETQSVASPADMSASTAKLIKSGKPFLCRSISDQRAHQLLTDGYVTLRECHAVGLLTDMKETA